MAKKKSKEKKLEMVGHCFADLCVYTIVVFSKWGGLIRHRVVTTTRDFEEEK